MATQVSTWQLVRFSRSIYLASRPYQIINYFRGAAFDLSMFVPAAAFGLWWASGGGGLRLEPVADWGAGDDDSYLFRYHLAQYYPMLLALAYGAILVWNRRTRLKVSWYLPFSLKGVTDGLDAAFPRRVLAVPGGITFSTAFGYAGLSLLDLAFVPGDAEQRFVPVLAVAGWVWIMRNHVRGRLSLLTSTGAGFRPPVRSVLRPGYRAIMVVLYGEALADRRAGGYEAAARALRHDPELQAWCLAKGIDWSLEHGRLSVAEDLVDPAWPGLAEQTKAKPAYLAARAMFWRAVGSDLKASQGFEQAEKANRGRKPYELSVLLAPRFDAADPNSRPAGRAVSARKIWTRRYALVLGELLDRARIRPKDPRAAAAARRIIELVDALGRRSTLSSLSTAESARLDAVKAAAHTFLAKLAADAGHWPQAATEHFAAARIHRALGDEHAAGESRARQALATLIAGGFDAQTEAEALDELRSGLQQIEDDRGSLRVSAHRAETVTRYETEIYAPILAALTSRIRRHHDRAAELVLWLMESTRRNALADALAVNRAGNRSAQAGVQAGTEEVKHLGQGGRPLRGRGHGVAGYEGTEAERRLLEERLKGFDEARRERLERAYQPKPVDIDRIYRRLGNRVALSYRCTAVDDGWLVTCVMASPSGLRLHECRVRGDGRTAPGSEPDWYKRAASTLSRIAADLHPGSAANADPKLRSQNIAFLHNLQFKHNVWGELAAGLLPAELGETLRRTASGAGPRAASEGPPVLVIVPDGPLCAIPFAGLRLGDGRALAEHAAVVFVPDLAMLADDAPRTRPHRPIVAANLGTTELVLDESALDLRSGSSAADLLADLRRSPPPDVALISNHGLLETEASQQVVMLADGSSITPAEATQWPWPATVVLGTCWAARMAIAPGEDGIGFPVACLLGGADTVVGSQAPIADSREAQHFVALAVTAGTRAEHPATALGTAMGSFAAAHRGALPAPVSWAALTVWSTSLPQGPSPAGQVLTARWAPRGTVLSEPREPREPETETEPETGAPTAAASAALSPLPARSRSPHSPWAVRRGNAGRSTRTFASKALSGLIVVAFLGAFVVTSELHQVGNAPSTSAQLAAVSTRLDGAVQLPGAAARPALFLGGLGEYYVQPAVRGAADVARQAARSSTPSSLGGWDVFLIPGDAAAKGPYSVPAELAVHAGRYPATVYCAGRLAVSLCFVIAHLPGAAVPSGSLWHEFDSPSDMAPGSYTMPVDVLSGAGPSGAVTTANLLSSVTPTTQTFTARLPAGGTIPLLSPVVLQGGDYGLPIFGVVGAARSASGGGDTYPVVPMQNITPYIEQLTQWRAGAPPGAVGVLGADVGEDPSRAGVLVSEVVLGSPADFAGLERDDVITSVGGQPAASPGQLVARIEALTPGSTVAVGIIRGGRRLTLRATIGYRPI